MKKILSLLLMVSLSTAFVGCGKTKANKVVSDFSFETIDEDNQKLLATDFQLSIGDAELPFLTLPLPQNYGSVRAYRSEGKNYVGIDLNLTEVLKLPGGVATLPNGTMLPVDTNGAGVIEIEISGINGKVYVAQKDDMTLVGFAFSIKQLDNIGSDIGTAGVFPNFDIGKINLTAGIFTGNDSGSTGLAAFANLGGLWSMHGEKLAYAYDYDKYAFAATESTKLTRRQKRKLYKALKKISKKSTRLDFVTRF